MNYFNHAKHTLSQLEGFLHDAMNEENLSAEEIYEVIIENVASDVEHYQMQYQKSQQLFDLLKGTIKPYEAPWTKFIEENKDGFLSKERESNSPNNNNYMPSCGNGETEPEKCTYGDMIAKGYWMSADGFWIPPEKDIVKSWILPVDDEGVIIFPEDLLEQTRWKEGDVLVYEISDGGVIVRKKEPLSDDENDNV